MNIEENRLNTFTSWPTTAEVGPVRIAKAGFYYTGQGVEVQCFRCGGKISEWSYGDQVMARHRRLDPNCPFVVSPETSGNVPLVLNHREPHSNNDRSLRRIRGIREVMNNLGNNPVDHGLSEEDEIYKNDALRLLSYVNWPDNNVSRELLVNAGFYHIGEGRVRCAWCAGELQGNLGPDPLTLHLRIYPHCTHAADLVALQETSVQNMIPIVPPIEPTPSFPILLAPMLRSTEENLPLTEGAVHNNSILTNNAWNSLGVIGLRDARSPTNASLSSRLATFANWPPNVTQTPKALAEAGFYYTGNDDRVRCYYCDGGLGSWETGDTPWCEHAKWFPDCGFLMLMKGREFIDKCRDGTHARKPASEAGRRNRRTIQVDAALVEAEMEHPVTLEVLNAGLDASRVRRAIIRRLQDTGSGFRRAVTLINAALDGQFDEEPWPEEQSPWLRRSIASDILYDALGDIAPSILSPTHTRTNPEESTEPSTNASQSENGASTVDAVEPNPPSVDTSKHTSNIALQEENRQLKEARICKVCMDREVNVVFLPCGHLISCVECGASLGACPLCRAKVRALVRAYLS